MSGRLPPLRHCERGSVGAEFALVLPLFLLMLLGTVDVGRFMWEVNRAEKATQFGARFAIVTNPVSAGLVDADFISAYSAGDTIPAEAIGALTCTSASCTCTSCAVSVGAAVNSAAFTALVQRMQMIDPRITAANVEVTYRGSGFGVAGDFGSGGSAEEMEISPLVTVALKDLDFTPITSFMLLNLGLPSASTTLPAEDASGTFSN